MSAKQYEVGQSLYWVSNRQVRGSTTKEAVTITKIGRRWMDISNGHRIDKQTLWADSGNYTSPGMCYASEADYLAKIEAERLFLLLARRMGYHPQSGVTADDIRAAAALLGLDLEEGHAR